eukprot:4596290-Pleurochrysis_carterae.AAC.4
MIPVCVQPLDHADAYGCSICFVDVVPAQMFAHAPASHPQVAPSNRVRDDWLRALRMLLVHMNLTSTLRDVANQKRILGDLQTSSGSVWAADILTHRCVIRHSIKAKRPQWFLSYT